MQNQACNHVVTSLLFWMTWLKNFLEWLSAIISVLDRVFSAAGDLIGNLWEDFPNVIKMVNHLLTFFNGLPGAVISGFSLAYFDLMAVSLEKARVRAPDANVGAPYQHVMTPANAIRYNAYLIEQSIRFLTLTRETNIVDVIFTALGRWVYQLLKRFELLRKIIGLIEEGDFIKFFQSMKAAKAGTFLVIAVISLLVFIMILSTATTGMLLFGGSILEPKAWQKFVLFSQHKRKKERVRISRRVGGVAP